MNGDMVGYIGDIGVVIFVMEVLDLLLGCFVRVVRKVGGVMLIIVDYGNCDEMFQYDKFGVFIDWVFMSYSLYRVFCYVVGVGDV